MAALAAPSDQTPEFASAALASGNDGFEGAPPTVPCTAARESHDDTGSSDSGSVHDLDAPSVDAARFAHLEEEAPPAVRRTAAEPMPPLVAPKIEPLLVHAEPTTFAQVPWWTRRRWTLTATSGPPNDVVAQSGVFGSLAVAGASIRGRKHRLHGGRNEDAFAIDARRAGDAAEERWIVLAVCDGMGSVPHSSYGSRTAADAVVAVLSAAAEDCNDDIDRLVGHLDRNVRPMLDAITKAVQRGISAERSEWERSTYLPRATAPIDELQCTLTFAVVDAQAPAGSKVPAVVGTIGDSPAFHLFDGRIESIEPAKGDAGLWSSATPGLLGATTWTLSRVDIHPGGALLLTSDGIGNFLLHDSAPTRIGAYLAETWSRPVEQLELLRDVNFDVASADDDRTAVIVWPNH